ncbi:MAG: hypothetical protein H0W13_08435 [Nitrospirales bacterium]|nr:hypothetical protein [Nitrospirales bacterium]
MALALGLSPTYRLIDMIPVAHNGISILQTCLVDSVPSVCGIHSYISSSVIIRASALLTCRDGADAA